jgi:hypothetical protein
MDIDRVVRLTVPSNLRDRIITTLVARGGDGHLGVRLWQSGSVT